MVHQRNMSVTQLRLGVCFPRLNVSERIFTMLTTASMLYTAIKEVKLNAMFENKFESYLLK